LNWKGYRRKNSWSHLWYYSGICWWDWGILQQPQSRESVWGLDLNQGPPEYEAWVLNIRLQSLMLHVLCWQNFPRWLVFLYPMNCHMFWVCYFTYIPVLLGNIIHTPACITIITPGDAICAAKSCQGTVSYDILNPALYFYSRMHLIRIVRLITAKWMLDWSAHLLCIQTTFIDTDGHMLKQGRERGVWVASKSTLHG
jgi:hypothetical protein